MRNKIMFLLLGIFFLSFASAVGSLDRIKQGDCVSLYNYCPTCTYMNWTTIKYPNGEVNTSINFGMTKDGADYNYTYCATNDLGTYFYTICGDKGGVQLSCEEIDFEVTTSGKGGSENIALAILLIVVVYTVTFIGYFLKSIPISILGGMFMTFFGVWIIRNGIVIYRDNLTNYFGYITIGIGAFIALSAAIEQIREEFF